MKPKKKAATKSKTKAKPVAAKTPPAAPPMVAKAQNAPIHDPDRARKRLIERYGWQADELSVQFPTDEALLKFYNEIARFGSSKSEEENFGWDTEDDLDAPAEEKARLKQKRVALLVPAAVAVPSGNPVRVEDAKKPSEEVQQNIPAKPDAAPVSFADFLAEGDALNDVLREINEADDDE